MSTSTTTPLVIERTFNASPELVWRALTVPEDIRQWFFPLAEFKAEPGFEFEFTANCEGKPPRLHLCRVTEAIPQEKLAYTWRYDGFEGDSLVTISLSSEAGKTRVKLTHEGLETFPAIELFARANFEMGWTHIVGTALKDFVENAARSIVISREFDAPRELVWEAMVNPKHIVNWWGPNGFTTTIEKMDFRVGGEWKHIMHGPDGTDYPNEKVFQEIVPLEKIVFTHGGKMKSGGCVSAVASWTFDKISERKTRVTLRMVFPTAEECAHVTKEANAIEGGKQTLGRLGEYLPKMAAAPDNAFVFTRTFNAPRELVWKAWTESARLMEWFGPAGFVLTVSTLDLRPGGVFHYAMRSPDGHEMWGKWVFREIVPPEKLVVVFSFSDAQQGITRHPMSATWPLEKLSTILLTEHEGQTTLTLRSEALNASAEEQQTFDAGHDSMHAGWSGTMDQLDRYLTKTTQS